MQKLRTKNEEIIKKEKIDLSIYVVHDIKIGELKLNEYIEHKDFFGNNLTYELIDVGATTMSLPLK